MQKYMKILQSIIKPFIVTKMEMAQPGLRLEELIQQKSVTVVKTTLEKKKKKQNALSYWDMT